MDCSGTYFTHAQTCNVTHVFSATEWTASVHTLHISQVRAARNTIMFADGNRAWRRAAIEANLEFYQVKHCLLEFSCVVTAQNGQTIKAATQCLDVR